MSRRVLGGLGLALLLHAGASAQVPAGGAFRVNTYTTGRQWRPAVAAVPGGFVVVWDSADQDGYGTGVFGQRYDGSGLAVGLEFQLNTRQPDELVNYAEDASVSAAPDGRFVAAWHQAGEGIVARRYDAAGLPIGPEFSVHTAANPLREDPDVASFDDGGFVVVWEDAATVGGWGILGRRYDASGNPAGAEFQVNTVTGRFPQVPDVAVAADRSFVVTWSSQTDSGEAVFARRYDPAGAAIGAQFQVSSDTTWGLQHYARVAAAHDGKFVVVWRSSEGPWSIVGRRFDAAGSPTGSEFTISQDSNNNDAAVTMAADGGFSVAWETTNDFDVFARRYRSSGEPEGPAFPVNSYTTDFQHQAAVASMPNGAFVVVWAGDDAQSSSDVFGQRYRAPDLIFADGFE